MWVTEANGMNHMLYVADSNLRPLLRRLARWMFIFVFAFQNRHSSKSDDTVLKGKQQ